MAFAGLKKQINKASQYMTEMIGGAEGTKLDGDFMEMERKVDITNELVDDIQVKTKEFLYPNPASRAKMATVKGMSKLSGQTKEATYPQPEGVLGNSMIAFGRKLGDQDTFSQCLIETGEAMKHIADIKYSRDDNIKQNFLDALHDLQNKDLKEVMHHRKKLQGRRLDYDCKKRKKEKGSQISEEEIRLAEDKLMESHRLAQMSMYNLLENDIEQISQLTTFSEALLDYHKQCVEILTTLHETLLEKRNEAADRPRGQFTPKSLHDIGVVASTQNAIVNNGTSGLSAPQTASVRSHQSPCAQAIYDFEPENPGELGFKEGDRIMLTSQIDENWLEGVIDSRSGYFPITYVRILVPLS